MPLKGHLLIPPGGWYYIQPETEFRIEADDFKTLVSRTIAHRRYKDIDPYDLKHTIIDIDQQICDRISPNPEYIEHA